MIIFANDFPKSRSDFSEQEHQLRWINILFKFLEKTHKSIFFPRNVRWTFGGLSCDISLTPKNIDFPQLTFCWLELDQGWISDMGINGPTFVPKSGYFLLIWVKVCPQKLDFS